MDIVSFWKYSVSPRIHGRIHNERGAALVEYALLLALIAVVCIVALQVLGTQANEKFTTIGDEIQKAGTATTGPPTT